MNKQDRPDAFGDLSEAARGLESELRRFEDLAAEAQRARLDTKKGITRAAKATTDAAAAQEDVERALGELVKAIKTVRERHEANAEALKARGEEIGRRASVYATLLERFSALGDEGTRINALVVEVADGRGAEDVLRAVGEVEERIGALVERARALVDDANAASVQDLAQQGEALRQQLLTARNKLGLLRKSLAGAPPRESPPN